MTIRLPAVLCGLCILLSGCVEQSGSPSSSSGKPASVPLRVVVTVGMVADLVRTIGGEAFAVTQIMGAGVDPHLYKPTADDVREIRSADVVFYSGLMLEGRLADTLETMKGKPVVAVAGRVPKDKLLTPEDSGGHVDPHVWMDVSAWISCCDAIADELAKQRPTDASAITSRAAALKSELNRLHEYGRTSLKSIPAERRVLITSHDAFNYFGRAYELEVIGVQGLSTESEAGLQRINELVDLLVTRKVSAVFVETSVPRKSITALIDGAKSRGHEIVIGGELFSDAMGPDSSYEGTYIGMLDHNITTVTRALGGTAPEQGLNGKLAARISTP